MDKDVIAPPEIDYLAKDYASFRQLMLDHFALRVPDWTERNEADLGIMLVEVLAYAADYLSYYQDAVATEAYLGTARRRSSIKHHVRLLDYVLHEGCNARVWVQVQVTAPLMLPQATQVLTDPGVPGLTTLIPPQSHAYDEAVGQQASMFETMYSTRLFPQHNQIHLYVEEETELSLPIGSTSALLSDPGGSAGLQLRPGDVLVLEEVKNATTGATTGADPTHRHALRLLSTTRQRMGRHQVLKITWDEADALPFPLPVALRQQGELLKDICVARGNLVLADHGQTIRHELLPAPIARQRYRPSLANPGLAFAVPYHHEQAVKQPASLALQQDVRSALPLLALFQASSSVPLTLETGLDFSASTLSLSEEQRRLLQAAGIVFSQRVFVRAVPGVGWELNDTLRGQHWLALPGGEGLTFNTFSKWRLRRDLLSSELFARDYTVDMEEDRRATLRFGFGKTGQSPQAGRSFQATYRVGGGEQGNVRSDTLMHVVSTETAISGVRNPLPARGGQEPEDLDKVRNLAPYAFRTQECCVTEDDYTSMARQFPQVLHVVARRDWPGNMPLVTLYVQREADRPLDGAFVERLSSFLETFRLAGQAFTLHAPYFAALRVTLRIWLQASTLRTTVTRRLAQLLSNTSTGFFAPARFDFGQPVYQSQLLAAIMAIPGVERVVAEQFCRFDAPLPTCEEVIAPGPLEIARLDNDEAAPYNGQLRLYLEGGL